MKYTYEKYQEKPCNSQRECKHREAREFLTILGMSLMAMVNVDTRIFIQHVCESV